MRGILEPCQTSKSKLAELVSLPYSFGSSTRYSNKLYDICITFPSCNKDFYINSSFPRTVRTWNSLPTMCFPLKI